jgi:hypothetical protein
MISLPLRPPVMIQHDNFCSFMIIAFILEPPERLPVRHF